MISTLCYVGNGKEKGSTEANAGSWCCMCVVSCQLDVKVIDVHALGGWSKPHSQSLPGRGAVDAGSGRERLRPMRALHARLPSSELIYALYHSTPPLYRLNFSSHISPSKK